MIDRIKSIIDFYHLSSTQFADKIGFQRSALSHVLSGRNNPSLDFVLKVKSAFPAVSLDWLALGKGSQFIGDKENLVNLDSESQKFDLDESGTLNDVDNQLIVDKEEKGHQETNFRKDFRKPESKSLKSEEYQDLSGEKRIRKVILLYDDGSFSEHFSEK